MVAPLTTADAAGGLPCLMDYALANVQMPILYYRTNYKYAPEYDTAKGGTNRPGGATDVVGLDGSVPAKRYVYYAATENAAGSFHGYHICSKLSSVQTRRPPPDLSSMVADRHRSSTSQLGTAYTIVQSSN